MISISVGAVDMTWLFDGFIFFVIESSTDRRIIQQPIISATFFRTEQLSLT